MNIQDPIAEEIQKHTGLVLTKIEEPQLTYTYHQTPIFHNHNILLFGILHHYKQGTHYLITTTTNNQEQILAARCGFINHRLYFMVRRYHHDRNLPKFSHLTDLNHPNSIQEIIQATKTLANLT